MIHNEGGNALIVRREMQEVLDGRRSARLVGVVSGNLDNHRHRDGCFPDGNQMADGQNRWNDRYKGSRGKLTDRAIGSVVIGIAAGTVHLVDRRNHHDGQDKQPDQEAG